jgi:membrane protease YdiL (CAAX protease family)
MTTEPEDALVFDAPPNRRGISALLIAILVVFVAGFQSLSSLGRSRTSGAADATLGDVAARLAVAAEDQQRTALLVSAEKDYRKALDAAPDSPDLLRRLAAAQALLGDERAARKTASAKPPVSGDSRIVWEGVQIAFGARPRAGAGRMRTLRAALEDRSLGWSRYVVLSRLADSALEADRAKARLTAEGARLRRRLAIVSALAGLALLTGLIVLLRYLTRPAPDRLEPWPVPAISLLSVFFIALVGQSVIAPLAMYPLARAADASDVDWMLSAAVTGTVLAFFLADWALRRRGKSVSSLGWSASGAFRWGVGGYLASVPLLAASLALAGALGLLFPNAPRPVNPAAVMAAEATGWRLAMVILVVVVAAPLAEELLFRGIMMRALARHFGTMTGAVLTSIVFASLHEQLPFGFFNLFATGMVLAMVYRATGSLVPCFVIHALNNGAAMALMLVLR